MEGRLQEKAKKSREGRVRKIRKNGRPSSFTFLKPVSAKGFYWGGEG